MIAPPLPGLHVICPDAVLDRDDAAERITALFEAGGRGIAVHLRPRETSARRCLELALRTRPIAEGAGGWLVINGRTDVARIARSQAAQLGHGALPVEAARAVLGPECAIGVSVHSPEGCRRAQTAGADYLLLGTIFPTPSHPGETGAGLSLISRCADAGCPLIAIGGVDESRIPEVMGAGAHGIAVIRAVWGSDDPVRAVRRICSLLEEQVTGSNQAQQQGESVMQIEVNGNGRAFQAGGSVRELLVELELDPRMVVVERNREIIRREELDDVLVAEGDTYEIVQFVGGG